MDYLTLLQKIHKAAYKYYKTADVTPDLVSMQGDILSSRINSGEDPTLVVIDAFTWIIQEAIEDSMISKGQTAQEAMLYMNSAFIKQQLIEYMKADTELYPNTQVYINIANSIDLDSIFRDVRDSLFEYSL